MTKKTQTVPSTDLDEAEARRLVAESRAEQGLPPTVTDPTVLQIAADLFRAAA